MSTVALRPRRVGEILDAAIKLYLANARTLMGLAAVAVVPLQALTAVVLLSLYSNGQDIPTGYSNLFKKVSAADAGARAGASGIIGLIGLLTLAFVSATCVQAVSSAYLSRPLSIRESVRFGVRRLPPLLVMLIVSYIALIIAFILLVIPGIWLFAAFGVATPALIIERRGPFGSLRRSMRLVRGRWWPTAGVMLVAFLMTAILSSIVSGVLTALALTSSNPSVLFRVLISLLAGIVSGVSLQPFPAAVTTVLYYDLRIRREGFDLQVLAEQLGLPAGSLDDLAPAEGGFDPPPGPETAGKPGGPPFWPPPPGWSPDT